MSTATMNNLAEREPHPMDVSSLPTTGFDTKSPLWWGNTLMMFIETTTVMLMVVCYFYCRRNFDTWPPPKVDPLPSMLNPLPMLTSATANLALLLASIVPAAITNHLARRGSHWLTFAGIVTMFVISGVSLWLRFREFPATHFSWGDNAYASIVWTTLALHLTYILAGGLEYFIMGVWLLFHDIDGKHALDVTLAGAYWYWVVGMNVVIYLTIFISPRVL